jgi:cyclopropane fatty-acyl-phospholipid synthase-like methyltransferase
MKNICEICKSKNLPVVLNLGKHPLCDDLIKIGSNKKSKLYKIEVVFCKKCITAYQKYQVPKKKLFPPSYHYRSKFTKDVISGFKNLVKKSKTFSGNLKNKTVLDIGCNDGSLLDIFKKEKSITVGIEPTNSANEAKVKGHKILNSYIDSKTISNIKKNYPKIDIITFVNVFAHIENLGDLISNLKKLLSKETVLIIENHYLGSIIKKKQFDTFYHEHPRTYSLKSFIKISKLLKTNIISYEFPKRYGGNIRVIFSKGIKQKLNFKKIIKQEKKYFIKLKQMNKDIDVWKNRKLKIINNLVKKYGPLPAKAFPGRAAILIKLLDLNKQHISQIFERDKSIKVGNYAPGTKIPIFSDKKLKKINKALPIINLAWHISTEIRNYLKKDSINNKVIDILEQKDFR